MILREDVREFMAAKPYDLYEQLAGQQKWFSSHICAFVPEIQPIYGLETIGRTAPLQDPIPISSVGDLGALIRARRREMKLRQADLSSISGIDQSNLSKIERSQIPAALETYLRLLEPLGIDLQAVPRE